VFKRRSATDDADPEPAPVNLGKGRATPSRKTAEAARAARVKPPSDTREARRAERRRASTERMAARKRMQAGDPKFLPARDRGPARAWVRTFVDSRWRPGELVLPAAGIVFLISLVDPLAYLLFYVLIISVAFDSVVLARHITRGVKANFPDEPVKGLRMYGVLRASQMRRMRVPKPATPRRSLLRRKPKG
jgi:Protein of unknown function (DUF3043)